MTQGARNGFDVSERSIAGSLGHEVDTLVDTTERRHIDGLTTDNTGGSDTGGVFTRSSFHDGVHENLNWVFASDEVDDFKAHLDDVDSLELFTVVAAVHHHGVDETLNKRALGLAESLGLVTSSGVRDENGEFVLDWDVVNQEMSVTLTSSKDHLLKS